MDIVFGINHLAWREYFINFLRALFWSVSVSEAGNNERALTVNIEVGEELEGFQVKVSCRLGGRHGSWSRVYPWDFINRYGSFSQESDRIKAVKLLLVQALSEILERPFPWGILVGVRPTKLAHQLLRQGYTDADAQRLLHENYGLDGRKSELLLAVARRQEAFFSSPEMVGVYVGIPYCPSRCIYCSFPSYPLNQQGMEDYFSSLLQELKLLGPYIRKHRLQVESVYVGGGTPTVLEVPQIHELFTLMREVMPLERCKEITFEAGRPDTITREKLAACRQEGVSRISINPQSMQPKTLRIIGRQHSVDQVFEAAEMARCVGFPTLNMDLIAGLPGETLEALNDTLNKVGEIAPENLTVHTLAIKRASRLSQRVSEIKLPSSEEVRAMLDAVSVFAGRQGMNPYYLYRQKHMVGDQENVGYAKEGHESIYNIQMMEDTQTIMAFGAGGGSKFLRSDGSLTRLDNPKDPLVYIKNFKHYVEEKIRLLQDSLMGY